MITESDARRMGETGAPPTEEERKLFEAWMRGHNWKISGEWDGKQYRHASESEGDVHPPTMNTRQLFAAWRDRGALAKAQADTWAEGWKRIFWDVALALDCLPSTFVDGNAHVLRKAHELGPDAKRLDFLDAANQRFDMGWVTYVGRAGNVSVQTIATGGKKIREAIDDAIKAKGL